MVIFHGETPVLLCILFISYILPCLRTNENGCGISKKRVYIIGRKIVIRHQTLCTVKILPHLATVKGDIHGFCYCTKKKLFLSFNIDKEVDKDEESFQKICLTNLLHEFHGLGEAF